MYNNLTHCNAFQKRDSPQRGNRLDKILVNPNIPLSFT